MQLPPVNGKPLYTAVEGVSLAPTTQKATARSAVAKVINVVPTSFVGDSRMVGSLNQRY
jgi:hypothetical protein